MSQLFEALQRSESERLGMLLPLSAAELVQVAEQKSPLQESHLPESPLPETGGLGEARKLSLVHRPESRLICLTDIGSLGAEKLRLLALRLKNLREKRKLKTVLITSTMPSEGKSLISANLAVTLARSKHMKTLLLECDLRRPTLSNVFVGRPLPGLSEYLQGSLELNQALYQTEPSGFFFLPAGFPPVNPLELMQLSKFQKLMEWASSCFDWVLIDSPPLLPLADTSLLMRMSDGILMVVREGVTEKKSLQSAAEMIDPARVIGVVLNGSTNTDHENYYQAYAGHRASPDPGSEASA
jgi:capsular exopolysaccharide synthesis family protein